MATQETTQTETIQPTQSTENKVNTQSNITELEVSPITCNLKVGETQTLIITTNSADFSIESSNSNVASVNKLKKTITGVGIGDATITIKAKVKDGEEVIKTINCTIRQQKVESFGSEQEILENTYHYDETLPLSTNGTIAYKTGNNPTDPLIKLVFDGKLQRWNVVGVKIVKFNKDNEPYSLYFMASEGAVGNAINNLNLEKVIIDLVDKQFQEEVPDMQNTIRKLFNDTINPIVQAEMNKIPSYVQNEITQEIQEIINRNIEKQLRQNFDSVIEQTTIQKIKEYNFGRTEPYHRVKQKPKWVGVLISNFKDEGIGNKEHNYSMRINTNGIEERWMRINEERVNDFTNNDELTQLFDQIEPYKSMERMEILCSDLKNIAGDSIYGKDMFERLMSQSRDRNNRTWNGEFYTRGDESTIFNRESGWFVPLKKCHYIDIEFSLVGDDINRYMLKAVGENEFTINIKDYFPNAVGLKINYFKEPRAGWGEFRVNGFEVTSRIHPAFLNYYDTQCNIMEIPMELDYIYTGAFPDVKVNTTASWIGAGNLGWCLMPKPFGTAYVNHETMKNVVTKYAKYMFGMNPSIGVNLRHMEHNYMHLIWLMQVIERGNDMISISKCDKYGFDYKWYIKEYSQQSFKTGGSWELGNKTGVVNYNQVTSSYRGLENILHWVYYYVSGVNQHNSSKHIYYQRPHTHRYVSDMYSYDGNNWVNTGYMNDSNNSVGVYDKHIVANSIAVFEKSTPRKGRHYCYSYNGKSEDLQLLLFGYPNQTNRAMTSYWHPSSSVHWFYAFRSCI